MCEADVSCTACSTGTCDTTTVSNLTDAQLSWSRDYIINVANTNDINLNLGGNMTEENTQAVEAVEADVEVVAEVEAEVELTEEVVAETAETEAVAEAETEVVAEVEAEAETEVEIVAEAEAEAETTEEITITETETPAEPQVLEMVGVSSDMYETVLSEKRNLEAELDTLKAASDAHATEMDAIRAEHATALSGMRDLLLKIIPQDTVDKRVLEAASSLVDGYKADAPLSEQDAMTVAKVLALSKTVGEVAESANAGATETVRKTKKESAEREFTFRGLTLKNYQKD